MKVNGMASVILNNQNKQQYKHISDTARIFKITEWESSAFLAGYLNMATRFSETLSA